MQKKITAVHKLFFGHVRLDFEDGTHTTLHRGTHESQPLPKVGDLYPPAEAKEAK